MGPHESTTGQRQFISEDGAVMNPKDLIKLAEDHTEDGRNALAGAVSQMMAGHLSDSEVQLASEILLSLLRQAETDLKEALSEKLSVLEGVPSDLIWALAHDEITVARPVLINSPVLSDSDLVYVIRGQGAEYWEAIAQRENLSITVTDALIDTEDTNTLLTLLDNERTTIEAPSMKKLSAVAMHSDALRAPLLRRPEADRSVAIDLYWCVSQELRRHILANYNIDRDQLDKALENLVQELIDAAHGSTEITEPMKTLASQLHERRDITAELLIKTLRRRQTAFFIALMAEMLELDESIVSRMIDKDGGKALAVACRSVDIVKSEFASIFLLSRGARTGDKIVDQRELAIALKCYDKVNQVHARGILDHWARDPSTLDRLG